MNRNDEFESLPFEWQMSILADRKKQEALMANLDKITDLVLIRLQDFVWLKNCNDVGEATKRCFLQAELFDGVKPYEGDDGYCKEAAKEFDFLRHLLQNEDRPIKRMQLAVDAIEAITRGDYEYAGMKASIGEFEDNEEYKAILEYWGKVNKL